MLVIFAQLYGQPIYVSNFSNDLYRFNPDDCTEEFVVDFNIPELFSVSDIAFLPSGTLYGLSPLGGIYSIDTISGLTDLVHELPLYPQPDPLDLIGYTSMVGYVDGLLYIASTVGDLYTYNPSTDTENYLGFIDYEPAGDLIWIAGDLYVSVYDWDIVRIDLNNLANSSVVLSNNDGDFRIFGLAPRSSSDCSVQTYLFSTGPFFSTTNVFSFGVTPSELTYNCTSDQLGVLGATSMSEFVSSQSLTYDIQASPGRCDSSDGRIEVIVSGGLPPFQYSLDGVTFQASNVFDSLANGLYTIFIGDQGNCTVVAQVTLEDDPPEIIDVLTDTASCQNEDGIITIIAAGNVLPLEYSLDDEVYQSDPSFNNLAAGSYTVYVRDSNLCSDQSFTVLTENAATQIIDVDVTPIACLGGSGTINVFTSPSGTELLYSLDSIEPLTFQQDSIFTDLPAGTYVVTAGNDEFCYDQDTVIIAPGQTLLIDSITTVSADCQGTGGELTVLAGEPMNTLLYSLDGINFQSDPTFIDLVPGIYNITLMSESGCMVTGSASVDATAASEIDSVQVTDTECQSATGGFIVFAQTAGNPITYSLNGIDFQDSSVFTGLPAGSYTIFITDPDNCIDSVTADILEPLPPEIIDIITENATCNGLADGAIEVIVQDQSTSLIYSLDEINYQASPVFSDLGIGDYTICVTDELGCTNKASTEVTAADDLVLLNLNTTDAECGVDNGVIDLELNRANRITAFLNGADDPTEVPVSGLTPGNYDLRLEDEDGCFLLVSATLESLACEVYLPNGFSPNGDGVNDIFRAYTYTNFTGQFLSLFIYDRWGGIVYRNEQYDPLSEGWDGTHRGKPVDPAVFAYVLNYLDEAGNKITLAGDLTVVR
ncbi:hypothetical protein CEQ90_10410 [Lewinellaceae bacterium SD302]|nr:hypothetical protein CEQ90_10410 [Lewinellaceae bacterium SD302]